MAASVLTLDDARGANFEVIEEDAKGSQAVHDMVTALRANRRSGTANTKTRGEVAATGKKPWRQKGTGRARAGGNASPIWRGGGTVFGPRPRSYEKTVNKRTRRLAFRKAFSERIKAGDVLAVNGFEIADGKTKSFISEVAGISPDTGSVLIISDSFSDNTYLAARNVQPALLISADEVNVEQLLYFDKIIVTSGAMDTLAQRTAK
ncbi:MAG: 50S ribosomal protein L4 [Verrucomicrobiota bacterium]